MKNSGFLTNRRLDILCIIVVFALAALTWHLMQTPDIYNTVLAVFVVISIATIIHEFTIKRHMPPTVAANIIDRGQLADALQERLSDMPAPLIIDLGSGHGELTRHIARTMPYAHVIGVEISRIPYWIAQQFKRAFGLQNLEYRHTSMYDYNCTDADAVVMYLGVSMTGIADKLRRELKPGAWVVSLQFPLPGWEAENVETYHNPLKMTVYIYRQA